MVTAFIHKLQSLSQSPYETAKKLYINPSIVTLESIYFAVLKFGQVKSRFIAFIESFLDTENFTFARKPLQSKAFRVKNAAKGFKIVSS